MLKGTGISEGIGIGKAIILRNEKIEPKKVKIEDTNLEKEKFYKALDEVKKEIEEIVEKNSGTKKEIMEAYLMILQDPMLIEETIKIIEKENANSAYAVEVGFNKIINMFENLEDPYMSARSRDIADMKKKILNKILGIKEVDLSKLPKDTIIIANELTTSDTANLDFNNIAGIITKLGGINSHMAIMARTHEIPAVVGNGATDHKEMIQKDIIKENDLVVINGETGEIYVNPPKEELEKLEKMKQEQKKQKEELEKYKNKKSITKDGHEVEILANIGGVQDVENVLKNTAEGIRII